MLINCADSYKAVVMRQPGTMTEQGETPATEAHLDDIQYLSWGRIDTDRSTASVEVSKCPTNRDFLRGTTPNRGTRIDPWAHELWIYRDNRLAFMGPIVYIRETRDRYIIDAWDMLGWLARRVIDGASNSTGTSATSAADAVADVQFSFGGDPDLVRHMQIINQSSTLITREWDAKQWSVWDIWQNLVNAGLRFTTLGRNILIFSQIPPNNTAPYLINADDVIGEMEIVKDGLNFATQMVCLGEGFSSTILATAQDILYYGRITLPSIRVLETTSQAELDSIAQDLYEDVRDLSPELVIPSGSTLAPNTFIVNTGYTLVVSNPNAVPLALEELVCGMRYDIQVNQPEFDTGQYPMRLGELAVTWTPEEGEKIAVSLKNLGAAASS